MVVIGEEQCSSGQGQGCCCWSWNCRPTGGKEYIGCGSWRC
ncbi:unnamed protein product [Arabidopsis lyrata]|nr:unnamed protein product [Arabidopsis lyrata]